LAPIGNGETRLTQPPWIYRRSSQSLLIEEGRGTE
jgi:hypothetical protein